MNELQTLQEHINNLTTKDWDKLISLLQEIENTRNFGELKGGEQLEDGSITFPYWSSSEVVDKAFKFLYKYTKTAFLPYIK
jgi:hypothetical protein